MGRIAVESVEVAQLLALDRLSHEPSPPAALCQASILISFPNAPASPLVFTPGSL